MEHKLLYRPISSIPPWKSTRNFTEEANAQNYLVLAEQHVYRRDQGRNTLNFHQQALKEQAARGDVHVAVAQATDMS